MSDETTTQDPAQIEQDIRRTQEEMSRTVNRIGDQLSPRNVINALLDKAESNDIDARWLLDGARRNPVALAMIAGGAIWLVSDSDAKLPKLPTPKLPSFGSSDSGNAGDSPDPHHRDYVSHMERVEPREGEEPASYQRRRDLARANYFMVEPRHDEDESGFRQRLDDIAETFRSTRHAWAQRGQQAGAAVSEAGSNAAQAGREAVRRGRELYGSNPLVGGLVAAAVGALFGSIVPITETEEQQLSGVGEKARELAGEQKDKLVETVREQKDKLVEAVDNKVQAADAGSATARPASPQPLQPAY